MVSCFWRRRAELHHYSDGLNCEVSESLLPDLTGNAGGCDLLQRTLLLFATIVLPIANAPAHASPTPGPTTLSAGFRAEHHEHLCPGNQCTTFLSPAVPEERRSTSIRTDTGGSPNEPVIPVSRSLEPGLYVVYFTDYSSEVQQVTDMTTLTVFDPMPSRLAALEASGGR